MTPVYFTFTPDNPLRVILAMDARAAHWVRDLLFIADDIEVIADTSSGERCADLVATNQPHAVLLGPDLSDMTGAALLARLDRGVPAIVVVRESLPSRLTHEAMQAGALDILVSPSGEQLAATIRSAASRGADADPAGAHRLATDTVIGLPSDVKTDQGRIVCLYSPKGGVGNSYLVASLARGLQMELGQQVAILDMGLAFGVQPALWGLLDAAEHVNLGQILAGADPREVVLRHASGVQLLAGPVAPEEVERLQREQVEAMLAYLRARCDFVLADCGPALSFGGLAVMDHADRILLSLSPELPAIKNASVFLRLVGPVLKYEPERVALVLTQSEPRIESQVAMPRVEANFGRPIVGRIPFLPDGGREMLESPVPPEVLDLAQWLLDDRPKSAS